MTSAIKRLSFDFDPAWPTMPPPLHDADTRTSQLARGVLQAADPLDGVQHLFALQQGAQDYHSLMCYVHPQHREAMEARLSALSQSDIENAARDINMLGAIHVNTDEQALIYLAALRQGLITTGQFATTRLLYAVSRTSCDVVSVPLSDPKAILMLRNPVVQRKTRPCSCEHVANLLNDDAFLERYLVRIKQLPLSEQQLFIQSGPSNSQSKGIYEILQWFFLGDLFGECNSSYDKPDRTRPIPSFGMMQAFLEELSPTHYVQMIPRLGGTSPVSSIRANGLEGTRDIGLYDPALPFPERADNHPICEPYDFSFHDFYHAIVASLIPPPVRIAFIQLADQLQDLADGRAQRWDPRIQEELKFCIAQCIDMEHPNFRDEKNRGRTDQEAFDAAVLGLSDGLGWAPSPPLTQIIQRCALKCKPLGQLM